MENTGNGTIMSPGVSTSINRGSMGANESTEKTFQTGIVSTGFEKTEASPVAEKSASTFDSDTQTEIGVNQPRIRGNQEIADAAFETAKTRSVDEALLEIANLDVSENDKVTNISEHTKVDPEVIENTEEVVDENEKSELQMEKSKIAFLESTVVRLTAQMAELKEENSKLNERAIRAEDKYTTTVEQMKAWLSLFKELIDEEKEKKTKEKDSLIAMFAKLIAEALTLVLVSEEGQKELAEEQKAA